jgi:hypothetical protein
VPKLDPPLIRTRIEIVTHRSNQPIVTIGDDRRHRSLRTCFMKSEARRGKTTFDELRCGGGGEGGRGGEEAKEM